MAAEIFYDDDADLSIIQGRNVAVLGYGSQGHAHSLSLRDSGVDVRVGLLEGSKSRPKAEAEGLRVVTPFEACEEADLIVVLAPDPAQRSLYAEAIEPNLIVDLMYEGGIAKQRWSVSDTAEYGDYTSGPFIIDGSVRARMRTVLDNIQDGSWAEGFIADQDAGAPKFKEFRAQSEAHP